MPGAPDDSDELHGVGVGGTRDEAIDAALVRLSQAIDVRVISTDETVIEGQVQESGGERSSSAQSRAHRTIRLIADQRLPGVRVDEVWRDPDDSTVYARVTLNRRAAAERFDAEVMEKARHASLIQIEAASAGAQWRKLAAMTEAKDALNAALESAESRDALAGAFGWNLSKTDVRELRGAAEEAWRNARDATGLSVVAADSGGEALVFPVSEALAQRSLPVVTGGAAVVIRCSLKIEPGQSYDATRRAANWRATLTATDVADRRTLATLRLEGIELARSGVIDRTIDAAMKKLDQALPGFLDDLFQAR